MTENKRHNFSESIHLEAFNRQNGVCALCGKRIRRPGATGGAGRAYQAHHMLRVADKGASSLENCVLLCIDDDKNENCHFGAHGYNFGAKFMLLPSEYKFFRFNILTGKYEQLPADYEPPKKEK